jgi:hypothetical protein
MNPPCSGLRNFKRAGPRGSSLLPRSLLLLGRGLGCCWAAAAATGCKPTPDGATPSTKPIDSNGGTKARTPAVDPVADAVAAAEQARLATAWLD